MFRNLRSKFACRIAVVAVAAAAVCLVSCSGPIFGGTKTKPTVFLAADSVVARTFPLGVEIVRVTLPEAFGSDDVMYRLEPTVPGLAFDPATRRLSGTPTETGEFSMTYEATSEGAGSSERISFPIRVVELGTSIADAAELVHASPMRGVLPSGADAHVFKFVVDGPADLLVALDPFETAEVETTPDGGVTYTHDPAGPYVLISGHGDEHYYTWTAGVEDAEAGTYHVIVRRFPGRDPGPLRYHVAAWLIPPRENGTFDIDVRYVGKIEPRAAHRRMMQVAVDYWSRALADSRNTRSQPVMSGAYECNGRTLEFGEFVDDLVVHMSIEDIEGRFTGRGGPCASREGSRLPYLGQVLIDPKAGLDRDLFLHELAHALGFVDWTWDQLGLFANPTSESAQPPFPDTHFSGPQAILEFDRAGGEDYTGAKVPLANDVSLGGLNSHWRASVFGCELMSYGNCQGNPSPVSRITLALFEDIGYPVNYDRAEPYRLSPGAVRTATPAAVHDDVIHEPVTVDLDVPDEVMRILTGE